MDALALGLSIILGIRGHLMVHWRITMCRDVKPKPAQCGTERVLDLGLISASPLQHPTKGKYKVKGKDHTSTLSREGVAKFISILATCSYF